MSTPILYLIKSISLTPDSWGPSLQIATGMWYNLAFMLLIISLFVILFRVDSFKKLSKLLQVYGRMSLSNFVLQSLIGSYLFYPYGLNLSVRCGVFISALIGMLIASVQILLSIWWLGKFKQGPLEYLWHKATYIR
jgi:uncharacterized protein